MSGMTILALLWCVIKEIGMFCYCASLVFTVPRSLAMQPELC